MTDTISNERLAEMLAGLDGVTPGPWFQTGAPWFRSGDGVLAGSPDGNIAFLIADTDDFAGGRGEYQGFPLGDKERDAAHISRCDPDTIRSLIEEVQASRRQSPAGVKVKGLEWASDGQDYQAIPLHHICYYIAPFTSGVWKLTLSFGGMGVLAQEFNELLAAKAAAQADYERRILSCLTALTQEGER